MGATPKLSLVLGADTSLWKSALKEAGASAKQLSSITQSAVSSIMPSLKTMSSGVFDIGKASLQASMQFNAAMANVGSLIPGNTARVNELSKAVRQMALDTGESAVELSGGLYQVVSAFGQSADSVNQLRLAVDLAQAGVATTTEAVNLIAAETRAYGDTSFETMQKVADLSAMTVRLGQTTLPELAGALPRVTSKAAALGVSMDELHAVFATTTGVIGSAAEVSTQFAGFMQALSAPTEEMIELFGEQGVESGKDFIESMGGVKDAMQAVADKAEELGTGGMAKLISSQEGQNIALAMSGSLADDYTEKLEKMGNAAGAMADANKMQETGLASVGESWQKLKAAITDTLIEIGNAIGPDMAAVFEELRAELASSKQGIADFARAALKGILEFVKGFDGAWKSFKEGLASFSAAIKEFIAGDFEGGMKELGLSIDKFGKAIEEGLKVAFEALKPVLLTLLDDIGKGAEGKAAQFGASIAKGMLMAPLEGLKKLFSDDVYRALSPQSWQDANDRAGGRVQRATGGPIVGPGSGTSDSIPAMLSNGEHVWTAQEVRNAGGHGAVYAMRQQVQGFAKGGAVGWAYLPSFADGGAVDLDAYDKEQARAANTNRMGGGGGNVDLDAYDKEQARAANTDRMGGGDVAFKDSKLAAATFEFQFALDHSADSIHKLSQVWVIDRKSLEALVPNMLGLTNAVKRQLDFQTTMKRNGFQTSGDLQNYQESQEGLLNTMLDIQAFSQGRNRAMELAEQMMTQFSNKAADAASTFEPWKSAGDIMTERIDAERMLTEGIKSTAAALGSVHSAMEEASSSARGMGAGDASGRTKGWEDFALHWQSLSWEQLAEQGIGDGSGQLPPIVLELDGRELARKTQEEMDRYAARNGVGTRR